MALELFLGTGAARQDAAGLTRANIRGAEIHYSRQKTGQDGGNPDTARAARSNWRVVFASERLTGALLDRITHHVHILEMNGESYRLKQSRSRRRQPSE